MYKVILSAFFAVLTFLTVHSYAQVDDCQAMYMVYRQCYTIGLATEDTPGACEDTVQNMKSSSSGKLQEGIDVDTIADLCNKGCNAPLQKQELMAFSDFKRDFCD